MILYTKPYQVIRNRTGAWVEGRWVPIEPAPVSLQLGIQPVQGEGDGLVCFANPGVLTARDAGSGVEGDIVIVHGQRYIVVAVDRWDAFGAAETAHDRYTLAQEVPKGAGEA